eukprot:gene14405-15942_t
MDPIVIFFAGKVGVGKSRTINNLVGSVVSRSSAAAESVTTRTSVVYQGTLGNTSVKLLDSSGLQDPHKKNVDTISDITNFIVSEGGIDVLYHIVSLGRLTDADIAIPNLLLDGLSSNSTERARLIRSYRIIVTHADSSEGEDVNNLIAGFKEDVKQKFPSVLHGVIESSIFIEHDQRIRSNYNDLSRFREKVVSEITLARTANGGKYRCTQLSSVKAQLISSFEGSITNWFSIEQNDVELMKAQRGVFQSMTETSCRLLLDQDLIPSGFTQQWNTSWAHSVLRNEVGYQ